MSADWTHHAGEMLRSLARGKSTKDERVAELIVEGLTESDAGGRIMQMILQHHEDELAMRRTWAEYIRREFGKYHEHSADGGECGACGAIQAANWMDPDYVKDGPLAEPFGTWRGRQPVD